MMIISIIIIDDGETSLLLSLLSLWVFLQQCVLTQYNVIYNPKCKYEFDKIYVQSYLIISYQSYVRRT